MKFPAYPKTPRFNIGCIVTEKIDGTNAMVHITDSALDVELDPHCGHAVDATGNSFIVRAGSRKRWIAPGDDNFGFAGWVAANVQEVFDLLGPGTHYGEWWGRGIQRGYVQNGKRFSLFDGPGRYPWAIVPSVVETTATRMLNVGAAMIGVVPMCYQGSLDHVLSALSDGSCEDIFLPNGSLAQQGYMQTEGVVVNLRGSGTHGQRFKIVWDKK